jgi:hypothetical protein
MALIGQGMEVDNRDVWASNITSNLIPSADEAPALVADTIELQ